jgi:TonB family protein
MLQPNRIPLLFFAVFVFLLSRPGLICQQTPTPAEPKDPKELMLAAARMNNLADATGKPWHLKASFQLFDEQGTVTDEGTYEEFWAGRQKARRIFSGKIFSGTEFTTDKGEFRTSLQGEIPLLLVNARQNLLHPLPNEMTVEHTTYTAKPFETGSLKLTCITPSGAPGASTFCLSTNEPILRIYANPYSSTQALYNRVLRFDGVTIAGDLKMIRNGKAVAALHVDVIESLNPTNEAAFTPPPDAKLIPIPLRVNISAGVAAGMIEYKVTPEYPEAAKDARISGTVVLQAVIGRDGRISALKVVSGHQTLQQAALDAVRQWRYRPYLLNGDPVEVMTTINVIFSLGGRPSF